MQQLTHIQQLATIPGPVVLAIGVFDGVHLGHQAVIRRALEGAAATGGNAVVVTFDPHPARVLRPDHAPRLLTATAHKSHLIEALGVPHLLVLPFDHALATTPPEVFVRQLHAACHPLGQICVGHEWRFGSNRSGDLALLERLGAELGFKEVGVPAVQVDDMVVSSTRIRRAVEIGRLDEAAQCLGRPYSILGTVETGDRLGRRIGFPTANLSAHSEQFPPDGVYAVEARVRAARFWGVVNVGVRPTLQTGSDRRVLEVHLLDFSDEIYGEEVEVVFRGLLRPEMRFAGLEALRAQIARDVQAARNLLSAGG